MGDITMTSQTSMTFTPRALDVGGGICSNAFLRYRSVGYLLTGTHSFCWVQ